MHARVSRLFVSSLTGLSAIAWATAGHAQAQGAPEGSDEEDAIVVTGSRIARPELSASIPVAIVSAANIENKGQTNALDAIRDIPIAGQSLDKSASNFSNFDNGISTVNLRNLGTSRTLVLN